MQVLEQRRQVVIGARQAIEALGDQLALALDRPGRDARATTARTADALEHALPPWAAQGGRLVLVADAALVPSSPACRTTRRRSGARCSDVLGPAQPLTPSAAAGTLEITPATAPVPTPPCAASRTRSAWLPSLKRRTKRWRTGDQRPHSPVTLSATTGFVVLILGFAFHWQATRAREADLIYDTVRSRIDTALNRGRCGLWDWDLARGRVFWSHSMFAILGLDREDDLLTFGEINALVHPRRHRPLLSSPRSSPTAKASLDRSRLPHAPRQRQAGCGCGALRDWRSQPDERRPAPDRHRRRHHRAEDPGRADGRRPICGCATPSRPSRKPSCCGTPTTAWCCATRTSRSCTTCPTTRSTAGTSYEAVVAAGRQAGGAHQGRPARRPAPGARTFEAQLDDGRWLHISERRTKDGGYVSVGTDITKLKLHEEKLMERRAAARWRRSPTCATRSRRWSARPRSSPTSPRNTPRRRRAPRRPTRPSRNSSPI